MREGTFQDETNPALTLINMTKESAKYKTRLEEINEFNEVIFSFACMASCYPNDLFLHVCS